MRLSIVQCVSRRCYFPKSNLYLQGTESELAGKSAACAGCENQASCASGATKLPDPALPLIMQRMADVRRKILILSGKGGVGKSTFTAQLGWAFAADDDVQVCRYFRSISDSI
jgi:Mrp family chromosome partitioning ATPase